MSGNIAMSEQKLLIAQSGGRCAFPMCREVLVEPGSDPDPAVFLGEMAHIVGESHHGPRGGAALAEEERGRHTNLILLCRPHHKVIDTQVFTYSVGVLQQMKADHERRFGLVTGQHAADPPPVLVHEDLQSTLLPVTHLPAVVFAAPCGFDDAEEPDVKKRLVFPRDGNLLLPFVIREKTLFAFHDLRQENGPFQAVIDSRRVTQLRATELWEDAEGLRRYQTLLNRALYKHTGHLSVRYDPAHHRYYFPVKEKGVEREEP